MIIFLNGSINAGKTTVARILARKLPNVALVEIDALHNMIDWMPIDQAVPINLENAASVIRCFSKRGLSAIVPYPLSRDDYSYLMDELKDLRTNIHVFTLAPRLEIALTNRGTRKLEDRERERIHHHYRIGIHAPSFGEAIDNSEQAPEDTANYILRRIDYPQKA